MTQNIQLGKAIGILFLAAATENFMHEDVSAFGAPSECHSLVSKGEAKRLRIARRHAKSVSGLSQAAFNRATSDISVMNPRWARVYKRIYEAHFPF